MSKIDELEEIDMLSSKKETRLKMLSALYRSGSFDLETLHELQAKETERQEENGQ
jgi:hypothetical protein